MADSDRPTLSEQVFSAFVSDQRIGTLGITALGIDVTTELIGNSKVPTISVEMDTVGIGRCRVPLPVEGLAAFEQNGTMWIVAKQALDELQWNIDDIKREAETND